MEDFKAGHRQRIKHKYMENKKSFSADYEILELLLTYSIPRVDVKPVAKRLLKECGSLDNVLNLSMDNLKKFEGVGDNTAILINLIKEINLRASKSRNANVKLFKHQNEVLQYFTNILESESNEVIALVSLDNSNRIINLHYIAEGTASEADASPRKIMASVIADNAVSVIAAHNHPNGSPFPSLADINFTINMRDSLKMIGVRLLDHIIVGCDDTISMQSIPQYASYFEDTNKKP